MSTSPGRVRTRYDFIKAQNKMFPVQVLRRVLDVPPSYYAWLKQPRRTGRKRTRDCCD